MYEYIVKIGFFVCITSENAIGWHHTFSVKKIDKCIRKRQTAFNRQKFTLRTYNFFPGLFH